MQNDGNKKYREYLAKIIMGWFFVTLIGSVMFENSRSPETNYIGSIISFTIVVVIGWFVFWNLLCFGEWCYYQIKALVLKHKQKKKPQNLRGIIKQPPKEYKIDIERLRRINLRFCFTTLFLIPITLICSFKYGLPFFIPITISILCIPSFIAFLVDEIVRDIKSFIRSIKNIITNIKNTIKNRS